MVAGIGSPHGDDQVGWEIAKLIRNSDNDLVSVRLARTPDDLLNWMDEFTQLVICDACQGSGSVGSFHRWKWPCKQLESIRWSGTHNVSLPAVLALGEQLGKLPVSVCIWGIEVEQTHPAHSMSEAVQAGAVAVAERICKELAIPMNTTEAGHA